MATVRTMLSSGPSGHVPQPWSTHDWFGSTDRVAAGGGRRRGPAADGDGARAAVQADARTAHRDHPGQPVRAIPRRAAQGTRRSDRAGQGLVGRGSLGRAAGEELPQPVGRRFPGAASRHQAGRPGLHRPVHADAARHHGRADGQRHQVGHPVVHAPVRDRSAAAGGRVRRRSVRQGRRGHGRRRQSLLLHHEGDEERRARRRRIGPRSRRPGDDADAGLLPSRAPDAGARSDADRLQHPGAHRRGDGQSRRPGLRRSGRRLLHSAVPRAGGARSRRRDAHPRRVDEAEVRRGQVQVAGDLRIAPRSGAEEGVRGLPGEEAGGAQGAAGAEARDAPDTRRRVPPDPAGGRPRRRADAAAPSGQPALLPLPRQADGRHHVGRALRRPPQPRLRLPSLFRRAQGGRPERHAHLRRHLRRDAAATSASPRTRSIRPADASSVHGRGAPPTATRTAAPSSTSRASTRPTWRGCATC